MPGPLGHGDRSARLAVEKFPVPVGHEGRPGKQGHHLGHHGAQVDRGAEDQPLSLPHLGEDFFEIILRDGAEALGLAVIATRAGFDLPAPQRYQLRLDTLFFQHVQGGFHIIERIALLAKAPTYGQYLHSPCLSSWQNPSGSEAVVDRTPVLICRHMSLTK